MKINAHSAATALAQLTAQPAIQPSVQTATLELAAGQSLGLGHWQQLWRLQSGALRLGTLRPDGQVDLISLALPGDLVGMEYWVDARASSHASAVVPTRLHALELTPQAREALLREALLTARQRCQEIVAVRTGPVPERVRALLLLLAAAGPFDGGSAPLPSIKEVAELVGSAPETVSRVLSQFKQLHLLAHRRRGQGALDVVHLRDARFAPGMTSSGVRARAAGASPKME